MRLFVAVTPPEDVLDQVGELVARLRGEMGEGSEAVMRWTTRPQWHVTLRFLGELEEPAPLLAALDGLRAGPTQASVGPRVTMLGRSVVCLPVEGLEEVAATVTETTATIGRVPEPRPFYGHLTLARVRRGRRVRRRSLVGGVSTGWRVDELQVMRSHQEQGGSRYETLATVTLSDRG